MRLALVVPITALLVVHFAGFGGAAEVDMARDTRLAQSVTTQCLNVRLHVVLEQLSAETSVTIRCGKDGKDWQVRDIPVTVCAKDMPLGKLLKSIAAGTHLLLSQEKVGKITFYRVWRDRKRQKEMDDFLAAAAAADMARAAWRWDAAVKLKDTPAGKSPVPMNRDFPLAKSLAALLAALGSEGRDRVMSGATIRLTTGAAPESMRGLLEALFRNAVMAWDDPDISAMELTPEKMQKCAMLIYLDDRDHPVIWISIAAPPNTDTLYSPNIAMRYLTPNSLPKPPMSARVPRIEDSEGDLKLLDGEAWDLPVLQTKISLEAPKNKKDITCGDLLSALAKASGLNIICEDFESHRTFMTPESLFKPDTTIGAVLKGLDHDSSFYFRSGFVWYVDEKNKLILGTADEWPFHHRDLVSDEFLAYLRAKLSGDGVGLDEFLQVLRLTDSQMTEWIDPSPDLAILDAYGRPSERELWLLYDSLSAQEKAQAQSKSGLSLDHMDAATLDDLLQKYSSRESKRREHNVFDYPGRTAAVEVPESSLVMKLSKSEVVRPRLSRTGPNGEPSPYPGGSYKGSNYDMVLEGVRNGEKVSLRIGGPLCLPIYSPERETALGIKPVKE